VVESLFYFFGSVYDDSGFFELARTARTLDKYVWYVLRTCLICVFLVRKYCIYVYELARTACPLDACTYVSFEGGHVVNINICAGGNCVHGRLVHICVMCVWSCV